MVIHDLLHAFLDLSLVSGDGQLQLGSLSPCSCNVRFWYCCISASSVTEPVYADTAPYKAHRGQTDGDLVGRCHPCMARAVLTAVSVCHFDVVFWNLDQIFRHVVHLYRVFHSLICIIPI